MLSHFHLIPERHGRTDRRADGQNAISISRVSVLTRDKNSTRQTAAMLELENIGNAITRLPMNRFTAVPAKKRQGRKLDPKSVGPIPSLLSPPFFSPPIPAIPCTLSSLSCPSLPSPPFSLPLMQLGSLGERCKLPQRGPGRRKRILWLF